MKKIIVSMHVTLDGFVAGPNGEMNWINLDAEMFDLVGEMTDNADTALYGRVTYEMMNGYWPKAGGQPDASKHDIKHSSWYNQSQKIVLSKTLSESGLEKTKVIGENITENIKKLKNGEGKNIMIFGRETTTHYLFNEGLIDELWLFINPVVIGEGIPLFKEIRDITKLNLIESRQFSCGVVGIHYSLK